MEQDFGDWVEEERWISACSLCEQVGIKRRLLQRLIRERKMRMYNGRVLRAEALRLFPGYSVVGLV